MRPLALIILLASITVCGCRRPAEDEAPVVPYKYKSGSGGSETGKGATPIVGKTMDGVIKGRIVYDGTPPEMPPIGTAMTTHKDASGCLAGKPFERKQQSWIIGKDNTVGNVVVYVAVPKGKYIELTKEDKDRSKELVTIDQPHCAFVPHVVAVYPSYFDGKAQQQTGQVFKALNNAGFAHNTRWEGSDLLGNRGNVTLSSGADQPIRLKAALPTKSGKDVVKLSCDIHPWMQAKTLVFDNPYHDVTRALDEKRADGVFELKNLPTGVELELVFWHEAKGGEFHREKITLTPEEKSKDLGDSIKVKE